MRPQRSSQRGPGPATTLRRLAFRLIVIITLGLLWPSSSSHAATAAAGLSFLLGVGCWAGALAFGEQMTGNGLNRWHEGAVLLLIALVLLFLSG